jgi:ribonucleoside-triphosphate reductase (formate)
MNADFENDRFRNVETTDITLFVRTSGEEIALWNRRMIVEAMIREAHIAEKTADEISREVERQIVSSGISLLTTALIRELVDAKLIERGMEHERRLHARLGFPLYDVRQLILDRNKENANVPHAPEGTSLALVEGIKREYALHDVFSQDIADAHISGDIHLHSLGYIDRPYGSFQSLEYLKKFGLRIPNTVNAAAPARRAEVLLAHMVRFGAALQGHISGVIGWDAVNASFAPFLTGMADSDIEQLAQMLVYEFSQLTSSRGGQPIFTDIHLYWEIPSFLANVGAVGPGGSQTGKPFRLYAKEARRFAIALMRVYRKGDASGKPFVFPRPIVHITPDFFKTPGWKDFLEQACGVSAAMGNPFFVLERTPGALLAAGASVPGAQKDENSPWKRRGVSMQNVTINLPRLGYRAFEADDRKLFSLLDETIEKAVRAHLQKREFIEKLMGLGDSGPLAMLAMNKDGESYLRMPEALYVVGTAGLNELVQIRTGRQMHESEEALSYGLGIVKYMKEAVDQFSKKHRMRFFLEQTPAETTAYRFARLDLKGFSPLSGRYVRGNLARGEIYYTNSTQLNATAIVDPMTRILQEGSFHPFLEAGATTSIELGDKEPRAVDLAGLIIRAFNETRNSRLVFSTEFTSCMDCGAVMRGIHEECTHCGSKNVDVLARITNYYSFVSGWNKGKRSELRDRNRTSFKLFSAI